jgi:hypothetical protein
MEAYSVMYNNFGGKMKLLREIICKIFGHRMICIGKMEYRSGGLSVILISKWQCERCHKIRCSEEDNPCGLIENINNTEMRLRQIIISHNVQGE